MSSITYIIWICFYAQAQIVELLERGVLKKFLEFAIRGDTVASF